MHEAPPRVLLADDEPFILRALRRLRLWEDLGCLIVGEATDGSICELMIAEQKPDILVSDIMMPGLLGVDLLKMISHAGLPVQTIFLSSHRDFAYARDAVAYAAVDYLLKPVRSEEMKRAVTRAIDRMRPHGRLEAERLPPIEDTGESQRSPAPLASAAHLSPASAANYTAYACTVGGESGRGKLMHFAAVNYMRRYCSTDERLRAIDIEGVLVLVIGHDAETDCNDLAEMARGALTAEFGERFDLHSGDTVADQADIWDSCTSALGSIMLAEGGGHHAGESLSVTRAIEFMTEHYSEKINLESVAEVASMNPYYFSSHFKKTTGTNFKDFLARLRVEAARDLLLVSDRAVYEIADDVGLSHPRRLSELFQKMYGKTPSQYRKEIRRKL